MLESTSYKDYPILFVDDEEMAIITFKHLFKDEFTLYTACNGKQALEMLEAHPDIAIVATDQRMPVMCGLDLLIAVAERYPEKINILITAYSALSLIVGALNKGNLFRYISKPYEEDFLKRTIIQGIERYHLLSMREHFFQNHRAHFEKE